MDLTTILDECLERIAAGESVARCLARYPEDARELAPLLRAAAEVRALSEIHLSQGQKLRTKVALREALAERKVVAPRSGGAWARVRLMPVAAMLAVVLYVGLTITTVASSQPSDQTYPVRVVADRVPVLVQFNPVDRIDHELAVADRRLTDLGSYLARSGWAHTTAIDALLTGDQAAARRAALLTPEVRSRVAEHVVSHADELEEMAGATANPQSKERLIEAWARARKIADTLQARASESKPAAALPTAGAATAALTPGSLPMMRQAPDGATDGDERPAMPPTWTPTPSPTMTPTQTPTRTPRPTRTSRPSMPDEPADPPEEWPTVMPGWVEGATTVPEWPTELPTGVPEWPTNIPGWPGPEETPEGTPQPPPDVPPAFQTAIATWVAGMGGEHPILPLPTYWAPYHDPPAPSATPEPPRSEPAPTATPEPPR